MGNDIQNGQDIIFLYRLFAKMQSYKDICGQKWKILFFSDGVNLNVENIGTMAVGFTMDNKT